MPLQLDFIIAVICLKIVCDSLPHNAVDSELLEMEQLSTEYRLRHWSIVRVSELIKFNRSEPFLPHSPEFDHKLLGLRKSALTQPYGSGQKKNVANLRKIPLQRLFRNSKMADTVDKGKKRKRYTDGSLMPSKKGATEKDRKFKISLQDGDRWAPIIGMQQRDLVGEFCASGDLNSNLI